MVKTFILIGIIVGIVVLGIGAVYAVCLNSCNPANHNSMIGTMMGSMMGNGNMMSGMMSDVPQDIIIKVKSSQQIPVGVESSVKLLVLDKDTKKPLSDAQVIVGIEQGSPMSTMNMVGSMIDAENLGNGEYLVKFRVDNAGDYTLHTHVIPSGKSMHSMMENHMDIGIIAK